MALIDKASLLMVPSTYEAGTLYNVLPSGNRAPDSTDQNSGYDQTRADFTFDRGTNHGATRIGSDGLIKKYRENLLTESNNFSDSDWVKADTSVTSGQADKDGGTNAWLLSITGAGGYQTLRQTKSVSGVNTISIYAKANALNWMRIINGVSSTYFDIANGVVGTDSSIGASIESAGNGFFRCSVPFSGAGSYVYIYPATANNNPNQSSGNILIQSAQLESGLVATDYLDSGATTAKAGVLIDLPRINYDANGENGALLLEPSRQNKIQYSEYFGASYWTKSGSSVVSGFTSPEGLGNAYKLVEGTNNGSHQIYSSFFSGSAGNNYTTSFFVKAGERTWCRIMNYGGAVVFFDLANGVKGTESNATGSIEPLANGWYKISSTYSSQSNERAYLHIAESNNTTSYQGNGSSGIYVFGAQAELGSYSSSYIPNHGTSGGVTRAADDASVSDLQTLNVFNGSEGALLFEGVKNGESVFLNFVVTANSNTNKSLLVDNSGGSIRLRVWNASSSQDAIITTSSVDDGNFKYLIKWNAGSLAVYFNGSSVGTDTITAYSYTAAKLKEGTWSNNTIKQFTLFSDAPTDAECITLTTL